MTIEIKTGDRGVGRSKARVVVGWWIGTLGRQGGRVVGAVSTRIRERTWGIITFGRVEGGWMFK